MSKSSLVARLLVVAILAVGLVTMHHLVVIACHHVAPGGSHGLTAGSGHDELAATTPTAPETATVALTAQPATPMAALFMSNQDTAPSLPADLLGAACVAVLLLILGLASPRWRKGLPGSAYGVARSRIVAVIAGSLSPPDLTVLSVSRT